MNAVNCKLCCVTVVTFYTLSLRDTQTVVRESTALLFKLSVDKITRGVIFFQFSVRCWFIVLLHFPFGHPCQVLAFLSSAIQKKVIKLTAVFWQEVVAAVRVPIQQYAVSSLYTSVYTFCTTTIDSTKVNPTGVRCPAKKPLVWQGKCFKAIPS